MCCYQFICCKKVKFQVSAPTLLKLFYLSSTGFTDVRVDRVGAGVYGAVTGRQKGAVAVSFMLKDAAFLFVASHLSRKSS